MKNLINNKHQKWWHMQGAPLWKAGHVKFISENLVRSLCALPVPDDLELVPCLRQLPSLKLTKRYTLRVICKSIWLIAAIKIRRSFKKLLGSYNTLRCFENLHLKVEKMRQKSTYVQSD